ncbi:MAG: hypothetical protein ACK58T_15280, partial [Phycisphaerae bacterium]
VSTRQAPSSNSVLQNPKSEFRISALLMMVFRFWNQLLNPVGKAIGFLMLTLMFWAVSVPIGLCLRMARRDLLTRRPADNVSSFWKEKQPGRTAESFFRRY